MFCPVCKGEFREGFTECQACRVALVEDLDNLPDKIEGEFKLCVECEKQYTDEDYCPDCGVKLVRALDSEDGYVLLEEVDLAKVSEEAEYDLTQYEYCLDLSNEPNEVLLESEDMDLMHHLMHLLNQHSIAFSFIPASEQAASALGSVFGVNSPLARNFPKILVRVEELEAATRLMASDSELGLFEVPDELRELDELDEDVEDL